MNICSLNIFIHSDSAKLEDQRPETVSESQVQPEALKFNEGLAAAAPPRRAPAHWHLQPEPHWSSSGCVVCGKLLFSVLPVSSSQGNPPRLSRSFGVKRASREFLRLFIFTGPPGNHGRGASCGIQLIQHISIRGVTGQQVGNTVPIRP